ncbi:caveolae-associated protein 2 [Ambystoma mexicanum]|uniref:caveolae-associated protein 2 n=1 Tax=Ambystoma mexicanum TaxID=8296 RepID=UPI0037E7C4E4
MGEGGMQAEKVSAEVLHQHSSEPEIQELQVPSPAESPRSSPSPGATEAHREASQVNPITVLTLLDKLVNMLDSVQENQLKMEKRQIELEGSVKGIQGDLTKLAKSHTSTSNAVSKLLDKSRKVSAHMRDVRDRMDRQCGQVKKLESNHSLLLRRNNFKVLIFQEENEIPANVFVKEPASTPSITEGQEEPNNENKTLEGTLHTVELSSDDEISQEAEGLDEMDEKLEESRAEKIKRSSLKKVDSIKKAFSRENIEKKMNKISTKIVSPERREKIKKSFTQTNQKTSRTSSTFKVSPLTFNVKKVREGESPSENGTHEETKADVQPSREHEKISVNELLSEMASTSTEEIKAIVDSLENEATMNGEVRNNLELLVNEDHDDFEEAQETSNSQQSEPDHKAVSEDEEELSEEPTPTPQPAVVQIDQIA